MFAAQRVWNKTFIEKGRISDNQATNANFLYQNFK